MAATESNEAQETWTEEPPAEPVATPELDTLTDLLHTAGAVVAVSSKVVNAKDFPEHLVDGNRETAWNSRTGDLHGWVGFRVPAQSRVTRVELTAGYDKGDVFGRNHRIARVRISREGVVLADTRLDPEKRELQGVDLEVDGGDFLIEVLETKPGTEKQWKELAVSELRVLGYRRGAAMNPRAMPRLAIGSLDGVPKAANTRLNRPRGPFPTIGALCAAWDAAVTPDVEAALARGDLRDAVPGPHCGLGSVEAGASAKVVAQGPFEEALWLSLNEVTTSGTRLVLRSKEGYSITDIELGTRGHFDPGCAHVAIHVIEDAELVHTESGRDVVVLRTLEADGYWAYGDGNPSGIVEYAYACDVDAEGVASCQGPLEVGRYWGWPAGWDYIERSYLVPDPAKVKWAKRVKPSLGPAGDLRAVPFETR